MEVQLVADTNLFFECKALESLPWSELGYDPVVILLTKPVLDEIDKHKKSSGRTRGRALDIWSRVRDMLNAGTQETVIQSLGPQVILRRAGNITPAQVLATDLDYSRTDDKLIGIVSTLQATATGYEVKLFTDDTGPASTADDLSIPYLMVNTSWRRPPAETTEDKQIKDLKKDLAMYRSQEPVIRIAHCEPADANNEVVVTRKVAVPLTEDEISGLIAKLRARHPLTTEFLPPAPSTVTEPNGDVVTTAWLSPGETAIKAYQDEQYPKWLEDCRNVLGTMHVDRDEPETDIVLQWTMSNEGTRPATSVRVEFEAQGPLELYRLPDIDDNDGDEDDATPASARQKSEPKLPVSPKAPEFEKQISRIRTEMTPAVSRGIDISTLRDAGLDSGTSSVLAEAFSALNLAGGLGGLLRTKDTLSAFHRENEMLRTAGIGDFFKSQSLGAIARQASIDYAPFRAHLPKPRDPEAFYYDWATDRPVKKGAFTCTLWRHRNESEDFLFGVQFTKYGEARGSVACTVHADNLSKPKQARVTVKRTIENLSLLDVANRMVDTST